MEPENPGTVIAQLVVTAEAEVIKAADVQPDQEDQP